jgi:hypothetical protein
VPTSTITYIHTLRPDGSNQTLTEIPQVVENVVHSKHRMEGLEWLAMLAKQVLSQLSYTPTVEVTLILKYFRARRNPFLRIMVKWSEPLSRNSETRF